MSEIMDKADVLERYARAQAASDEPTLVRDTLRHLLARLDAAEARLSALKAEHDAMQAAQGWQPIETAPKDAMIIGHADGMIRLVMWESEWVQVGVTIEASWFQPTHWNPLPTPPADKP